MEVLGVKCPYCKEIIYSRARHDFRRCSCGNIFVDGGKEYLKYGGENIENIKFFKIELDNIEEKDLLKDWLNFKEKYGKIKPWKQNKMKKKIKPISMEGE